jgi:hypothetical protein
VWFFIGETMKTHIGGSPYSHTNPYFLIDDRWQTFLPFYSGFSLKMAPIRIGSQHVPATWVLCHHMVWKPWQQPGQVPWRHSLDGTLWGSTFLKELSWVIVMFFFHGHSPEIRPLCCLGIEFPWYQWEFQDPNMEVLYHIRPYFVVIFTYIGLNNRPYIW